MSVIEDQVPPSRFWSNFQIVLRQNARMNPAGEIRVVPVRLNMPLRVDTFRVEVTGAQAGQSWGAAIYDVNGDVVEHVDSSTAASTGVKRVPTSEGWKILPPGD